jgi:hypothetical protein
MVVFRSQTWTKGGNLTATSLMVAFTWSTMAFSALSRFSPADCPR